MQGNNPLSVFATHLLKYIKQPIPLIELMLNKVVPSKSITFKEFQILVLYIDNKNHFFFS